MNTDIPFSIFSTPEEIVNFFSERYNMIRETITIDVEENGYVTIKGRVNGTIERISITGTIS